MDAIVTAKCEHPTRAATPGLSRAPAYSEQLQRSGQGTCNSRTPQTQPGRFGRHLGENISIYKLLLSLQGLQHLPKFHTEVASDPKFECEHSNFFCWRLLKVTILDFHPQNVLKMLIFLKPTFHCLSWHQESHNHFYTRGFFFFSASFIKSFRSYFFQLPLPDIWKLPHKSLSEFSYQSTYPPPRQNAVERAEEVGSRFAEVFKRPNSLWNWRAPKCL